MYTSHTDIKRFIDWYIEDYIKQMRGHWHKATLNNCYFARLRRHAKNKNARIDYYAVLFIFIIPCSRTDSVDFEISNFQDTHNSKIEFTQIITPRTDQGYYTTSFTYKQTDGTIYIIHHYFWQLSGKIFAIPREVPRPEQLQHELKCDYIAQSVQFNR